MVARPKAKARRDEVDDYDDSEVGSIDRFKSVIRARLHVLMRQRRDAGQESCNAGSAKAFLFAVANHDRGHELGCVARQSTLQRESGLDPSTQTRIAEVLENCGLLTITRRHKQTGVKKRRSSNQYHIDWKALAELEHLADEGGPVEVPAVSESAVDAPVDGDSGSGSSGKLQDDRSSGILQDDPENIRQSAGCSSGKLQDDHLAVCGRNYKQTTTQGLTTQQGRPAAAVPEPAAGCGGKRVRSEGGPVCLSSGPADLPAAAPAESVEARRAAIVAAADQLRRRNKAIDLLIGEGVWRSQAPELVAHAAKSSADENPIPRIEAAIAACQRATVNARRSGKQLNPGKWLTAAILEDWQFGDGDVSANDPDVERRVAS